MNDALTTPQPSDSAPLRAARLELAVLRMSAERVERNAALRRAQRPAPRTDAERLRVRNREYDAVRRAKQLRERAGRVIERIRAAELAQAANAPRAPDWADLI